MGVDKWAARQPWKGLLPRPAAEMGKISATWTVWSLILKHLCPKARFFANAQNDRLESALYGGACSSLPPARGMGEVLAVKLP